MVHRIHSLSPCVRLVGFDDKASLGKDEQGLVLPFPFGSISLTEALKDMPIEQFTVPEGIILKRVSLGDRITRS